MQRIQLTMKLTKSTYSDDRASYYQPPWEINKSGVSVTKGNLVAFNKTEIVPELVRQVQYFLTMKFNYFMYDYYIRNKIYSILKKFRIFKKFAGKAGRGGGGSEAKN